MAIRFVVTSPTGKEPTASPCGVFLYADETIVLQPGDRKRISMGVSCVLPDGVAGILLTKTCLALHNKVDVVTGKRFTVHYTCELLI
jgi:dUTPase